MKHSSKKTFSKIYLSLSLSLSLCFLISSFPLNAQFITEMDLSEANLTTLEATRWQHISNMTSTQSITLVEIESLSSAALSGDIFTLTIPGVATGIYAQGRFIQQTSNDDYVVWANLADDRGYFGIASNASGKVAYAQIDGKDYMMYLISNRYNALVKVNSETNIVPQLCLDTPASITVSEECDLDNDCPAVVSVLVLVTPEAMDWLGGNYTPLESLVYFGLGLNTVNFALLNSGVYHKSVRFIVESYDFQFSPNPNPQVLDDLILLQSDTEANNRRTANRADLMFLIADSRYYPLLGAVLNPPSGFPYLGIVSMEFLISKYYTFAHEMGHTFLLNHNRMSNLGDINYNGEDFCAFGWRFETPNGVRKTIMAKLLEEDLESSTRVLNYSNPNIVVDGTPTGTPINFNARHASHNICRVADYFIDNELNVDITGPIFVCEENVTYTANITPSGPGVPGVAPYNVRWGVCAVEFPSLNDPMIFLGSANSLTLYSGSLPNPVFWLFVSVISADGVFMNDIIRVDNPCGIPPPFAGGTSGFAENDFLLANSPIFELSPNPTSRNLKIQFFAYPKDPRPRYSILNSLGELAFCGVAEISDSGEFDIELGPIGLPNGLYYFHLSTDAFSGVQKFVIQY